jgi:cell division protein FtsI/penicillin-binding protein 2
MEKRRRVLASLIAAFALTCAEPPSPPNHVAQYRAAAIERRAGVYPFVYDRNGSPLAKNHDFSMVTQIFEAKHVGLKDRVTTTLDPQIQHIALRSLGELRASLVAIDPRTNEVVAVATNEPDPFERQYEPGSVIKVLTLLAALNSGVDVQSKFPFDCRGALPIDGRSFGDWHAGGHGALPDLEEALAESCNVVFAAIGLETGRERLRAFHKRAGFDSQVNLGLFRVPLGKTVGYIFNNFETGFYSIGLEHESVTTFHLAMLASMLANRGALTTPRIFRERRSVLGQLLAQPPKQTIEQLVPREIAERVVTAMQAVVTRPKGTGRRASVDGVPLALKTGTAGSREQGYDALVIGFAPADHPAIAFALIAENAGAAEFAAAKVAHDFIDGLRAGRHL